MKPFVALVCLFMVSLVVPAATNSRPSVQITHPPSGVYGALHFKIKAEASDPNGSVAEVRFFANDKLIGVATNAPFNIVWLVNGSFFTNYVLTAEAKDQTGSVGHSAPTTIVFSPTRSSIDDVSIVSPLNGALFATGEDIQFSAEVVGRNI